MIKRVNKSLIRNTFLFRRGVYEAFPVRGEIHGEWREVFVALEGGGVAVEGGVCHFSVSRFLVFWGVF